MTRLRIALVLGTASGGTARHAAMLARGCASEGLGVSVFGPEATRSLVLGGPDAAPAAGAGITFRPVPISDRIRPARDGGSILRLRRLLAGDRPHVVHAHGLRAGAFAALALALGHGPRPPLLVTVHNAAPSGGASSAVYRVLERLCARRADLVLCASGDLEARMRQLGARATRQAVVAAPAARAPDPQAVAGARSDMGAADRPVVLAVGRLAAQKGLGVLLAAAARWRQRDPRPRLVIAGDGPLAAELAARCLREHLDVAFLGPRDDVPALLAAADVVVVPSLWEARAMIIQEALRAGRPIVASRVGGIPELTGADGALLVPPGQPGPLAAAVLSVLDDPGLAGRLAAAALARATDLPAASDVLAAAIADYRRLSQRRPSRDGGRNVQDSGCK